MKIRTEPVFLVRVFSEKKNQVSSCLQGLLQSHFKDYECSKKDLNFLPAKDKCQQLRNRLIWETLATQEDPHSVLFIYENTEVTMKTLLKVVADVRASTISGRKSNVSYHNYL